MLITKLVVIELVCGFLVPPFQKLCTTTTGEVQPFVCCLTCMSQQLVQMTDQIENWLAIMATHFEILILCSALFLDIKFQEKQISDSDEARKKLEKQLTEMVLDNNYIRSLSIIYIPIHKVACSLSCTNMNTIQLTLGGTDL